MKLQLAQVDAFADRVFQGNPAAICPLDDWLDDSLMQSIATENNLSETAYILKIGIDQYAIRWFTPDGEVDLCGHATLATAHLLFERNLIQGDTVSFQSKSGVLPVSRLDDGLLVMDFPAQDFMPCEPPQHLLDGLGMPPKETYRSMDYLVVLENQQQVIGCNPQMTSLLKLDQRGVIITAPGLECDFVSRFFGPKNGIPEDPVTGSAHCILAPYWAKRLNKSTMHAHQVSKRGGRLICEISGNRVFLKGRAITYMTGEIQM
ncbi:MAG: PhzF family phenazine biosynthesis protein [Verrucomicrobia bacterium]|nr:PhzF family phenazine biosynthesis protein [Verrucomicrobiota bacterium]